MPTGIPTVVERSRPVTLLDMKELKSESNVQVFQMQEPRTIDCFNRPIRLAATGGDIRVTDQTPTH